MCGIAGIIDFNHPVTCESLQASAVTLSHRGPDSSGVFLNPGRSAGFAHTRLSILDLSSAGRQPMTTSDGRFTITFNGEIYNYLKLKEELQSEGCRFVSGTDTEVLLHLYAREREAMLPRLEGMFAFAIWDEAERTGFLARDPLGIKPLYYSLTGGRLAFASELRTLIPACAWVPKIDARSLAQFLLFGSVPEPGTIVDGMSVLPAGTWMEFRDGRSRVETYWEPTYGSGAIDPTLAVQQTRVALDDSIQRHLVSDVPVGVFLSGGIDSSAILALAKKQGGSSIDTFCISFNEAEFNEGDQASRTAKHFGANHHDWRLTAQDGHALVDEYLNAIDQPSNDGFNTYCVSKFARRCGFKVVLSGLGGDELFGSYPSFRRVPQLLAWHARARALGVMRQAAGRLLARYASAPSFARAGVYLQTRGGPLAAYWAMRGFFLPDEVDEIVSHYLGASNESFSLGILEEPVPPQPSPEDTVAYLETTRYMRHQLLRDSDIFSMAHGLELRVPLVDRKLFDQVNTIPASVRLAHGKRLFCEAVPELPDWVTHAPKRGFRFPFEGWAQGVWNQELARFDRRFSFKIGSWYRKWALFTLEHFLRANGLI